MSKKNNKMHWNQTVRKNMAQLKTSFQALTRPQQISSIIFVALFAAIGTYSLLSGHAAPPPPPGTSPSSCPNQNSLPTGSLGRLDNILPPCQGAVSLGLGYTGTPFGSNFWGQQLPATPGVNPNSNAYVSAITGAITTFGSQANRNGYLQTISAPPVYVVPADQPKVTVQGYNAGSSPLSLTPNNPENVNIAKVVAGGIPIPPNATPAQNSDLTMIIYQPAKDRLWELWKVKTPADTGGNWEIGAGGRIDNASQSNGIFPDKEGTSATHDALMGVVSRIEELQEQTSQTDPLGQIDHPIDLELPASIVSSSRNVWPAYDHAPDGTSTDPNAIPEGLRLRLNLSLDQINSLNLTPVAHAIAVAAQKYGFMVENVAPSVTIKLGNSQPYTAAGLTDPYAQLFGSNYGSDYSTPVMANFPWASLQALPDNYGSPPSTAAPNVSLITPIASATLSGLTTVQANATDGAGITSIQFQLDGENLGNAVTAPDPGSGSTYSVNWDTSTASNGNHVLTALVTDQDNNTAVATVVNVNVSNSVSHDNTPPTVSMSAPVDNASVTGNSVTVSATATDKTGIKDVHFQLDGNNLGNDVTSPTSSGGSTYSLTWDTTSLTNGSTHSLTAMATDNAGNSATTNPVTVTINNKVITPPSAVKNFAWDASSKTLTWSAYPGASAYVISTFNKYNIPSTTYTYPPINGTSYKPQVLSDVTVAYNILPEVKGPDGGYSPVSNSIPEVNPLSVSWPKAPPTIPPAPTGLSARDVTSSQVSLQWNADPPSYGVTSYKVYRDNGNLIDVVTDGTSVGDTGLQADTSYSYYVVAHSSAGKDSPPSAKLEVTTKSVTTNPKRPTATLRGRIVNSRSGDPISNAYIRTGIYGTANGAATAHSNADGQYILIDITPAPNRHYYTYSDRGYSTQNFSLAYPSGLNLKNIKLVPRK